MGAGLLHRIRGWSNGSAPHVWSETQAITVRPVVTWSERRRFQRLPWSIYAGDPNWVPPILSEERKLLGWKNHPFYDNAEIVTLLAERGGKAVGRLAVFVNHIHNRQYDEQLGFFGFFECIDDVAVARSLFAAGATWLRQRGMTAWRGPVNPSLNYTCGLLINGFDRPPCFLMTYNRPYYGTLLEACGFGKAQDLYAYELETSTLPPIVARYKAPVLAALDRPDLVIRPFDPFNADRDIAAFLDIYNRSLEGTWGFTPLQEREAREMGRQMRHLIDPAFAVFAEVDGKPIGAMLALLDYNQILRHLNGRLFPTGILRLLTQKKNITAVRAMAMTMVPGYQRSGLGVVLLDRLVEVAKPRGIKRWEFSWILESNSLSRGSLERSGVKISKTYRIYDKSL